MNYNTYPTDGTLLQTHLIWSVRNGECHQVYIYIAFRVRCSKHSCLQMYWNLRSDDVTRAWNTGKGILLHGTKTARSVYRASPRWQSTFSCIDYTSAQQENSRLKILFLTGSAKMDADNFLSCRGAFHVWNSGLQGTEWIAIFSMYEESCECHADWSNIL